MADLDLIEIDHLVAQAQKGDNEAFRELVLSLQRELGLYLAPRCSHADIVEELVQRTFVTAYERLASYDLRGTFPAWLKGIAYNHLRDHYRERRRAATHHVDALEQVIATAVDDHFEIDEPQAITLERLKNCLKNLKPRARDLIESRYTQGKNINQIAQQFSKSAKSITSALFRIRNSLRSCVEHGSDS